MALLTTIRLFMAFITMFALSHCTGYKKNNAWDSIDYSKVRNRGAYENDNSYRLPNVSSCTDDDLYNCN